VSKSPRASYYVRLHDLIVSATSTLDAPDALDDLRVAVTQGFFDAMTFTTLDDDEMDEAAPTPRADLPPID
jgi:hypothetical protein